MAKTKKKFLARKLRRKGYSISEIAEELDMQKSGTISRWCRDISLTSEQINRLDKKQKAGGYKGRMKYLEKVRKKRKEEQAKLRKEGLEEVGEIDKRDLFIGGVAIYVSEGFTSSSKEEVSVTNADPKVLLFMLKWFRNICGVDKDRFSIQVRINESHEDRVEEVENYWSEKLDIPLSQFTKTILIRSKNQKTYPNREEHYGTVRITVKQGTQLRRKIEGWIEGLLKDTD